MRSQRQLIEMAQNRFHSAFAESQEPPPWVGLRGPGTAVQYNAATFEFRIDFPFAVDASHREGAVYPPLQDRRHRKPPQREREDQQVAGFQLTDFGVEFR